MREPLSEKNQARPDTGLLCLVMILKYHNIPCEPEHLKHEYGSSFEHMNEQEILLSARKMGLHARLKNINFDALDKLSLPAILCTRNNEFFILAKVEQDKVLIQHPTSRSPEVITAHDLKLLSSNKALFFVSKASLSGELARFDLSWFIPAVIKYRKLFSEVLIVSFFIQILALITPLFFQVIMDKVLVHHTMKTLDVITIGLAVVFIFEVLLNGLRSYVFSHTTSRIDVELGANIFRHILKLPVAYFHARQVGDTIARVKELENIRSFITGNAITIVMDILFSVVFIAVMIFYSGWLTLIVVGSLPLYILVSLFITPVLRRRLNEKFARNARNHSFLVETVSGIDTAKSLAIEPILTKKWDEQLAGYVRASFRTNTTGVIASSCVTFISKLVSVLLIWQGATLVIDGQLTIGGLIAFNMLSGQVTGPIMRLAQLWTDFQQVGISVARLGDVLNTRTELSTARTVLPMIKGTIDLENVIFRYRPDGRIIIRDLSLSVKAGEVLGIVGQSGSGKSTLTRLIQRLYVPEQGKVKIDGHDISLTDITSLRRQIGVVLQENFLFNASIRENIAVTNPAAPLEEVVRAATLAGAHQFILDLQEGYDTQVGEHGVTLSGGQRQRIAIARALMHQPRILIFDEATSALDYESEKIIQDNMRSICEGRTVIIIAHRLSAVRNADRIIVMGNGEILEQGAHHHLLEQKGHYHYLHQLQNGDG